MGCTGNCNQGRRECNCWPEDEFAPRDGTAAVLLWAVAAFLSFLAYLAWVTA